VIALAENRQPDQLSEEAIREILTRATIELLIL